MAANTSCSRNFALSYELGRAVAVRDLERAVLGSDYGATSWTTRDEAIDLADWLDLRPGVRVLDVGAGSGWPGLYFALATRCEIVLTDIPVSGLRIAMERSALDGTNGRCQVAAADGSALPFADNGFHAISHCDVLCCLPRKLAVLQECRRVARDGARMAFSVILPAAGVSARGRRRAIETGPEFVDVESDYATLLEQSGWRVLERVDVTGAFGESLRTSLRIMDADSVALTEALGVDIYRDRMNRRRLSLMGVEEGVLRRELFAAICGG